MMAPRLARLILALVIPGWFVAACAATSADLSLRPGTVPADDGARIVKTVASPDPRLIDLTVASPALGRNVRVRLLLPRGWTPGWQWPVLYLLHGVLGGPYDWTIATDISALSARTGVIIAMPDGGQDGYYSNWWNGGRGGPPRWEEFHTVELPQLLARDYGATGASAIAGVSMGGYGAIIYAARHPGMFNAAAAFSGGLDLLDSPTGPGSPYAEIQAYGADPRALWGDPIGQHAIWVVHDPITLAAHLRRTKLFISCGNGRPGPLDPPGAAPSTIENVLGRAAVRFAARSRGLGVDVTTDFYGAGTHTWPYWQRELHRAFPMLMAAIYATATPN